MLLFSVILLYSYLLFIATITIASSGTELIPLKIHKKSLPTVTCQNVFNWKGLIRFNVMPLMSFREQTSRRESIFVNREAIKCLNAVKQSCEWESVRQI